MAHSIPSILILAEHPLVADALARSVVGLGYQVIGPVTAPQQAHRVVQRTRPDLILADLGDELAEEGAVVAEILSIAPTIPTVILAWDPEALPEQSDTLVVLGKLLRPKALQQTLAQLLGTGTIKPSHHPPPRASPPPQLSAWGDQAIAG